MDPLGVDGTERGTDGGFGGLTELRAEVGIWGLPEGRLGWSTRTVSSQTCRTVASHAAARWPGSPGDPPWYKGAPTATPTCELQEQIIFLQGR